MQYSFKKVNIIAPFATTQCGHSCQTFLVDEAHDPCFARITAFKDENIWIIHYSLDVLAFDQAHRHEIQKRLRKHFNNDNIHVITSATHTHYANSVRDEKYPTYLTDLLVDETMSMKYKDVNNVTTTYQRFHTNAVGKSRISGYETNNEMLCLVRFYSDENNFLNIVYNNCHPTILSAEETHFFSAEYPGYVLAKLESLYPNIDFSFLQGAAGDISSRFVRDGQDYAALAKLGDNLVKEIVDLIDKEVAKVPFKMEYNEVNIKYEHDFAPIDLSNIRSDLSERELHTIKLGQEQRQKLQEKASKIFGALVRDADVASLDIGSVKIIFFPNEIFSEYMNEIDLDKKMLVSYSNGYGPYVLPTDFKYITYEMFTDTTTNDTKELIAKTIREI